MCQEGVSVRGVSGRSVRKGCVIASDYPVGRKEKERY